MAAQIIWFRQDLRLSDQPALAAAAQAGPVIACFCLDDAAAGAWAKGGAQRWWLHHSLTALGEALSRHGVQLVLRQGNSVKALLSLQEETNAQAIHATQHFEPFERQLEKDVGDAAEKAGWSFHLHRSGLLREPDEVRSKTGGAYKVFTPYWRASQALGAPGKPAPAPSEIKGMEGQVQSDTLDAWGLLPKAPDWSGGLSRSWTPGEGGALERLGSLSAETIRLYKTQRDLPAIDGTSQLSAHLHFGEISARQVWHNLASRMELDHAEPFIRQLGWRDFSSSLLYFAPSMPETSWSPKFIAFPWREDTADLARWQKGQTGYPMVDAGMRQLWQTGWMHNRVRMITASFLTKHLLLHWRQGEDWFWDTLVDADLANNAAGWQWVAGSGADASPYFRIFNPITQSEKFDADGTYIRRYVPELADLSKKYIHAPWTAPQNILAAAGIRLGETYPKPMVDHSAARTRALDAYEMLKAA